MVQNIIIDIGVIETLAIIAGIAGSLISVAWFASGRFARLEALVEGLDKRMTNIEGNFVGAFIQQSPIGLTEKGMKLLGESGLHEYIDSVQDELIKLAAEDLEEIETTYDIQDLAFDFFDSIQFDLSFEKTLKEYAYESGVSMQVLRRVAGIYFRDVLIERKEKLEAEPVETEATNT